ncbi:MAG: DarT ssDNA thymidine ADP-ribosyltransferase family protein [Anaerolineae bacterium]|nr:DarT ssDNA thymidine ADP-ribosyltransferase family protein [Anaerolineae bacterium]
MAQRTPIFISYARADARDLALRLSADLQSAGYPVWLDLSEIPGGSSWSQQIEQAIESCEVMVALMSPAAYGSQWCRAEQLRAIRKGKRLVPLLAVPAAEIPLHLEHLNYVDFTVPALYGDRFRDLLSDIRAGEAFQRPAPAAAPPTEPARKEASLHRPRFKAVRTGRPRPPVTEKRNAPSFRRYLEDLRAEPWLGARFWWPYFLFHYTDLSALVRLLHSEELVSPFLQGAALDARWDKFVRLYFRPRTPDLFLAEGFRPGSSPAKGYAPVPVYLLFDLEAVICHPEASFSYGDPAKTRNTYRTPMLFREMPFERIYHDSWFMPDEKEEIMRCREAQVMIPERLGLDSLQLIWLRSPAEYETLHHLLPPETWRKWRDKITARTDYHLFNHRRVYVQSVALRADQAQIRFNPALTERDGGLFHAVAHLTAPDGSQYTWEQRDFAGQSEITLRLPAPQPGYTLRLLLDGDLAYAGTHTPDGQVL